MEILIPITLFIVTGGVLILRPITKHLGDLLEAMALQRRRADDSLEASRLRDHISTLESRIALLEERQSFTDSLLATRRGQELPVESSDGMPFLPLR